MNKPLFSMIRHIQNRNNGYSRPSTFSGSNYSSLQTSAHTATHGATALNMNTFADQEEVVQQEASVQVSYNVNQAEAETETKTEKNIDTSENKLEEGSLFSQNDPIEFQEESFEKIENETQLFTNDDEVNSTIETRETHSFDNDDLKEEIFSDSESESKDDLEIPAFLRRQTN